MKKYIGIIIIAILLFVNIINVYAKGPEVIASNAVLIDGTNNRVLYGKEENEKVAMASTTKIMTCLIVLENADLNDVVKISSNASKQPKVKMYIKEGEQYLLKDLLYALMLESYNDVAVAIAEHVGGSTQEFAEMMNKKAKELGMINTNFVTPNGLDADGHYSTAYDMAILGAYAIRNDDFVYITNTKTHQLSNIEGTRSFVVSNKNKFLSMRDGAIGIKTGFTSKAGYCFVGAMTKGEHTLVSVVLGSGWPPHKEYKWQDTLKLMDYGLENYKMTKVIEPCNDVGEVKVIDGKKNTVKTYIDDNIEMLCEKNRSISYEVKMSEYVEAPVKKDQVLGEVKIIIDDKDELTVDIKASYLVEKKDVKFYFLKFIGEIMSITV